MAVLREVFKASPSAGIIVLRLGTPDKVRQVVQGRFRGLKDGIILDDARIETPHGLEPVAYSFSSNGARPRINHRKVVEVGLAAA